MSLTLLPLNVRDEAVRRDLTDVRHMHRTVMSLIHRADSCVLWGYLSEKSAIVISHRENAPLPTETLPAGYLAGPARRLDDPDARGDLRLRGIVNPTRAHRLVGERGHRMFIEDAAERRDWCARQLVDAGEITSYEEVGQVRLHAQKSSGLVTIKGVDVRMTLRISDPLLANAHLRRGIGRGKAYGCGLLIDQEACT